MIELSVPPFERLEGRSLWVKRDDLSHAVYGGNKPRKLRRILALARREGATRLLTVGAAGSHHVLATAVFGRAEGFRVGALLTPQPRTEHVVEVLRAGLAQGLEATPLASLRDFPAALRAARGALVIPPGGSNVEGALAFAEAVAELRQAIERGEGMRPEVIVVAAGSGGTAAGLAAGLVQQGLPGRVLAVAVARPPRVVLGLIQHLAARAALRLGLPVREVLARVSVDDSATGRGYGHASPQGDAATPVAAGVGLHVDPTYTAKAFAVALEQSRHGEVLYWHTLSSAPLAPLLVGAPAESDLDPGLRALLLAPG